MHGGVCAHMCCGDMKTRNGKQNHAVAKCYALHGHHVVRNSQWITPCHFNILQSDTDN